MHVNVLPVLEDERDHEDRDRDQSQQPGPQARLPLAYLFFGEPASARHAPESKRRLRRRAAAPRAAAAAAAPVGRACRRGRRAPPPRAVPLQISIAPNPLGERAEVRVFDASVRLGLGQLEARIFDVQGRLVRRLQKEIPSGTASPGSARFTWDGRDDLGRRLGSGRYWLRVREGSREASRPVLILR